MYRYLLGLFLICIGGRSFAQCKTDFSDGTKIAEIKQMLQCWQTAYGRLASQSKTRESTAETLATRLDQATKQNQVMSSRVVELEAAEGKLDGEKSALTQQLATLNAEKTRLSAVWANTSLHKFNWSAYSVDSCKNEATKDVVARGGTYLSQTTSSISFSLREATITVECRADSGGFVTVASHSQAEATTLSKELDSAIFD